MKEEGILYNKLGVPVDATTEELKHAYREAARRLHPDTNKKPGETELFLGIQNAYDIITDPQKRLKYDASLPDDIRTKPQIELIKTFSRPVLPRIQESQLVYLMLQLKAPQSLENADYAPVNLCLVVDSSTSMQGALLDSVKATAVEITRHLRTQDIFGLISFNDNAQVILPSDHQLDRQRLETSIRMMRASGGTEIFKGLEAGYQELEKNLAFGYSNHIILLTDGRTYGDELSCLHFARRAKLEGITISALGIGEKWNDEFLDKITSITGGNTTFARTPREIRTFLQDKFISLSDSYASHVSLKAVLDPRVELKSAFRMQPEASPLEIEIPIQMGSLNRTGSLVCLLELEVTPLPEDIEEIDLLKGTIMLEVPSRLVPYIYLRFSMNAKVAPAGVGEPEIPPPPQEILQALSRYTLYRMEEKARAEVDAGDVDKAAKSLRFLATGLLERGENELARTVIQEAVYIEQNQAGSEEGKKRIKYGTRSLLPSMKSGRLRPGHIRGSKPLSEPGGQDH